MNTNYLNTENFSNSNNNNYANVSNSDLSTNQDDKTNSLKFKQEFMTPQQSSIPKPIPQSEQTMNSAPQTADISRMT